MPLPKPPALAKPGARVAGVFAATLFDFNGVLVDDEHVHLDAMREVLAPYGISITDEAYRDRYLGFDDAGAFRAMLTDHGRLPSEEEVAELVRKKIPVYMRRVESSLVVFDGAPELVRARAEAGPVGIVSGALRHEIDFALELMGVKDHVAFIVSAEDTARCKPDPEGYELGVAKLASLIGERRARQALVFEDSLAGIRAAKSAGLPCMAVAHSYGAPELWAAGADDVASKLRDIDEARLRGLAERLGRTHA